MADNDYSSAAAFKVAAPGWVPENDKKRIASYGVYDGLYKNDFTIGSMLLRGADDEDEIVIPSAKALIKAQARYVGRGFGISIAKTAGTEQEQIACIDLFGKFFIRERVLGKFATGVKQLLRRGDLFWFISADPAKPEGSRVSLDTVSPEHVFLVKERDKLVGYQIVESTKVGDKAAVKVQKWLKPNTEANPASTILYTTNVYEEEGWNDEAPKDLEAATAVNFPAEITALPVYHMKNDGEETDFGVSELAGLERIVTAINQSVTDENITLSMAGLGMYKSSSGGPVDENNQTSDWIIGPGQVVEDETFERVNGVGSISPSQDHIKYLEDKLLESTGITPITLGDVDTTVAESGIALSIRMAPTVDMAEEKDIHIKDVFDHILYDLKFWFKVYEGIDVTICEVSTQFGDKMPRNRENELNELLNLYSQGVLPLEFVHEQLQERFGYKIPSDIMTKLDADAQRANANADPFGVQQDGLVQDGAAASAGA